MKNFNSFLKNEATAFRLAIDKVSFIEVKLSLLQRYKLKKVVRTRSYLQYFNKFIKKFLKCDVGPKSVYEEVLTLE